MLVGQAKLEEQFLGIVIKIPTRYDQHPAVRARELLR
jgi:hypothetical protein